MKRAFLKTVFHITVLLFCLLMGPLMFILIQIPFQMGTSADGHYRSNPGLGMLTGMLAALTCLWIADRGVSFLFRVARLFGEERWSMLPHNLKRQRRS